MYSLECVYMCSRLKYENCNPLTITNLYIQLKMREWGSIKGKRQIVHKPQVWMHRETCGTSSLILSMSRFRRMSFIIGESPQQHGMSSLARGKKPRIIHVNKCTILDEEEGKIILYAILQRQYCGCCIRMKLCTSFVTRSP